MKKLLVLSIVSLVFINGHAEEGHDKHHNKHTSKAEEKKRHAVKTLALNNGKKWDVDQTMKENMNAINLQFNILNTLISSKKVTTDDYSKLSKIISDSTQTIAANCKMEQKKDETFHTVLGDLLAVSEDLKDAKKIKQATEKLTHALKTYTQYFDHTLSK